MKKKLVSAGATAVGLLASLPAFAANGINLNYNVGGYGTQTPEQVVINLINWVLGILALIAVILILIGGFRWMTAAGNEEKVDSARKLLIAAVIGLIIVMAAWGIAIYAVRQLATATGATVLS